MVAEMSSGKYLDLRSGDWWCSTSRNFILY